MPLKQINSADLELILHGLARGEYNLFLGAGSSIGAKGGDGRELPSGKFLIKELLHDFELLDENNDLDLREIYDAVENKIDRNGRSRDEYFRYRFSNCVPSWQNILTCFLWKRIWTINVDDVVENAYWSNGNIRQRPRSYNWNDPFSDPDYQNNELQIIHLHGYAPKITKSNSFLIFSILEYLRSSSSYHAWHRIFGDEYLQRPFILVGAKLTDEYDLAEFLRRGCNSRAIAGRPSLIVLRDMSSIKREQFVKWGLIPVHADAITFFSQIVSAVKDFEAKYVSTLPTTSVMPLTNEARIFLQQFVWLRSDFKPDAYTTHDFYQGDEPSWSDILLNLDAKFEIIDRTLSNIATFFSSGKKQLAVCISGSPGAGKSAALLRIGKELLTRGFDIFIFRGEERLNISAAIWWLNNSPKSVLLFDGVADYGADVGNIMHQCAAKNIESLIIATERDRRLSQVYEGIEAQYLASDDQFRVDPLSDVDIDLLIAKLAQHRRLGKLTRRDKRDQVLYFKKFSSRQLLVGMSQLEGGRGFIERIKDEYHNNISNPQYRDVYALCCITYSLGYPLPYSILCAATGVDSSVLCKEFEPDGQLYGVLRNDGRGLKPRHRVIASLITDRVLSSHKLYKHTLGLAKALAPYITTNTIRQRTLPYRIARILMDQDVLTDMIGIKNARLWYEELSNEYDWNARFWEQRALVESRLSNFPRARSFAEHALSIQKHTFTLNTLGTILIRMSYEHYPSSSKEGIESYWEGVKYLATAKKNSNGQFEHPFTAFFAHTLQYATSLKNSGTNVDERLSKEWQRWLNDARNSVIFKHTSYLEKLNEYRKQWLMLAVQG
jgi:hypothetical protein